MKKTICIVVLAIASMFYGCTNEKIQIIHNDSIVTNSIPMQAFNDESYVWENWSIGTNRVDNID